MRTLSFLLALLLVSSAVFGQKKSKVDPKDVKIDSLTKATKSLTVQLDSVSGELVKYTGLYDVIKEKVIHYKFDPTRSAYLIDSLRASRDSISVLPKAKVDTIKPAEVKPVVVIPQEDLDKANAISGLKQLKELLDAKIITDAEFLVMKKKYLDRL